MDKTPKKQVQADAELILDRNVRPIEELGLDVKTFNLLIQEAKKIRKSPVRGYTATELDSFAERFKV